MDISTPKTRRMATQEKAIRKIPHRRVSTIGIRTQIKTIGSSRLGNRGTTPERRANLCQNLTTKLRTTQRSNGQVLRAIKQPSSDGVRGRTMRAETIPVPTRPVDHGIAWIMGS
jgi:hypothetical protein